MNTQLATDYHLYAFDLILTVLLIVPNEVPVSLRDLAMQISRETDVEQDYCGLEPRTSDSDYAALLGQVVLASERRCMLVNLAQDLIGIDAESKDSTTLTFLERCCSFLESSAGECTSYSWQIITIWVSIT